MKSNIILLAVAFGLAAAGKHDIYSRNSIHGVKLRDKSDQGFLSSLMTEIDLDIFQYGESAGRDAVVMITPENRDLFLAAMDEKGIEHYVRTANVTKALEEIDDRYSKWKAQKADSNIFELYRSYEEVDAYLEEIAAKYTDIVTIVTVGKSYEGRDIKYLKISTTNFADPSKPVYFMDATMHAREWVTAPVALYSIYRLVESVRSEDRDLLSDIDWIILPMVNPDGYEFSRTKERLWRKTRSINSPNSEDCIGVDPNRNFDIDFNTVGVSTDPCALNYPGPYPFSEAETQHIRDIMVKYRDRLQIYMDIHSFGNWILFAYGNERLPPNAMEHHHVGSAMGAIIDTLKLPEAEYYKVGNAAQLLYQTSGDAADYATSVGIPFSFTLELPGYSYDFEVPPEYIEQIYTETWPGIAESARLARAYYRARYNPSP